MCANCTFLFRNPLIWKVFILHLIQEFLEKIENVYFFQGRELNFLLFGHKYNYWKKCFQNQSGYISAQEQNMGKIRALSFLQLLKFKKRKCSYFPHILLMGRDIATLIKKHVFSINIFVSEKHEIQFASLTKIDIFYFF